MNYQTVSSTHGRGQCLPESPLFHFLQNSDPADWFRSIPDAQKHGTLRNSCIQEFHADTSGSQLVFCKLYPIKKQVQALAARVGYYKARSIFDLTRRLSDRGVRTPRPIAYFICQSGYRDGSFLFLENLAGATDLRVLGDRGVLDRYFQTAGLMDKCIDLMVDLHAAGYCHRDFKFPNLLWQEDSDQLYLIDFDGTRKLDGRDDVRGRARDLARFTLACHQARLPEITVEMVVDLYQQRTHLDADLVTPTAELYQVLADRHYLRRR